MKKIIPLALLIIVSCSKNDNSALLKAKDKTIDSLKVKLEDCTAQAKIMAEIVEKERIELQNKKATK